MRHPHSRGERRGVRLFWINQRKKKKRWHWYHINTLDNPPHEGDGYRYESYLEYLKWINLAEEEKKVLEVLAVLEGKDTNSIRPWWEPDIFGKLAKWNMTCSCWDCKEYKSQTARRKERRRVKRETQKTYLLEVSGLL